MLFHNEGLGSVGHAPFSSNRVAVTEAGVVHRLQDDARLFCDFSERGRRKGLSRLKGAGNSLPERGKRQLRSRISLQQKERHLAIDKPDKKHLNRKR